MKSKISAVPTNIITGFLGVGKTSTILQLFKHKPANERWAVLVNEFGEIGVDGALFSGQYSEQQGVFIREVPGGCMCCAAGVPMQIALNQLLLKAKPDRLFIEPTGLGHPKEVLTVLSKPHYQPVLNLQKTITLVDARNLTNPRYTNHDTFNQQIAIADMVIGNKVDLYQKDDKSRLINYVKSHGLGNTEVLFAQHGEIHLAHLAGNNTFALSLLSATKHGHQHSTIEKTLIAQMPIPESGFIKAVNHGEGFTSIGWRFSASKVFDHNELKGLLTTINAERIKASCNTNHGRFRYNVTNEDLTKAPPTPEKTKAQANNQESFIEVITFNFDKNTDNNLADLIEAQLLACIR